MRFYYFNSSHWDREWYLPFERFRIKLIELAQCILDRLENDPEYGKFTFDGQTVWMEDVEEIRPDLRTRLDKLIAAGKLNIGPWYTMPDEFLVSGEALIRNLLIGRGICHAHGCEPWPVGYVCDIFGHIAQLPQILAGFSIGKAVAARGIAPELPPFLRWRSPDGTEIGLLKYVESYGAFTHVIGSHDEPIDLDDEAFKEKLRNYVEFRKEYCADTVVLQDGGDHSLPHHQIPQILKLVGEMYPGSEVIASDYRVLPELDEDRGQPVVSGELVHPGSKGIMRLVANSLSARYDIKLANDLAQNRLELELEPYLAIRGQVSETDRMLLLHAWKELLKNQAHDSVCGCSPDETHRMQMYRYGIVHEVADGIIDRDNPPTEVSGEDRVFRIFNPLPVRRKGVFRVKVPLPSKFPQFSEPCAPEGFPVFRVLDPQGNEVKFSLLRVEKNQTHVFMPPKWGWHDDCTLALETELNSAGWTEFRIVPAKVPRRPRTTLRSGLRGGENEYLKLEIRTDGTFRVTDKETGAEYDGFNNYLLDSDTGDGWYFTPPLNSCRQCGAPESAAIRVRTDSEMLLEFEIVQKYRFPKALDFQASVKAVYTETRPSDEEKLLTVSTVLSLERGARFLRVHSTVENELSDFRMRLVVPTGMTGDYFAGQAFTLLRRAPGRIFGDRTLDDIEAEVWEKNFSGILARDNGKRGLAFLNPAGLHEAACVPWDETNIYVTLFRSFRRTVFHNGEPDGALHGRLEFDYVYRFFPGPVDPCALYRELQELRSGLSPIFAVAPGAAPCGEWGTLRGNAVLSALKPSDDGSGTILRLFNPGDRDETAELTLAEPVVSAHLCDLAEREISLLCEKSGKLKIKVPPQKAVTVKMRLEGSRS